MIVGQCSTENHCKHSRDYAGFDSEDKAGVVT